MGLPKGRTNNPAGRPKGIRNKKVEEWTALGEWMTGKGADRAMSILTKLDDGEFLSHYEKLVLYFRPKLSSANITASQDINLSVVSTNKSILDDI